MSEDSTWKMDPDTPKLKGMKSGPILLLLSLTFLLGTGCERRPTPPKNVDGIPIAKIDDRIVFSEDLKQHIGQIEAKFPRKYTTHPQKKELLEQLINLDLLYQEALDRGFERSWTFRQKLVDAYVESLSDLARASVSDKTIEDFFKSNREAMEQISARHILLKTEAGMSDKRKAELKNRLEILRSEALKDPQKFGELASQHSQDSSARNKGELGFFNRQMMVAPFSKAAFQLQKLGDLSPIVETQYGFHLIQLTGERRSVNDFREQIREHLLRNTQRERVDQEIARLRKSKKIEIYENELLKLSPLPKEVNTSPEKLIPKDFQTPDNAKKK